MAGPNIGMDIDKLKQLLRLSKKEPMNCAVAGNSADASMAFILLDKVKAPKAVSAMLDKENPKNFNLRWGTAVVDTDIDPKLVTFTLNKNVTGMAKKLKKTLKGTGYTKVVINFEDGTSDADMEEGEAGAPPPPSGAQPGTIPPAPPPPPGPNLGTTPPPSPDSEETGTEAEAEEEPTTSSSAPPASEEVKAKHVQSARAWITARTNIQGEIDKLKAELLKTYQGQEIVAEIEKAYLAKVKSVTDAFDLALAVKLNEASKAGDAAAQQKLGQEAKAIATNYVKFVTSDPLVKDLDENPFVPLGIRASVIATLKQVSENLK
ncbi:hypothetical protein JYK14_05360 [Siccirubricoccus sp. KC 17139]|uniref:Uncharacterized protein n=1 Tax=Siccirubricoccus soli TaxID=2899147 RepID=A0ABT1D118_9PROT|nr:hypothetical protein [Siccirubricoccus soli]MCO6415606.1 hypothetical protein [Siccirubricoccus soli]MCP2681738.1 hypothetical protein [Siccirubricoccus soli]